VIVVDEIKVRRFASSPPRILARGTNKFLASKLMMAEFKTLALSICCRSFDGLFMFDNLL
jgi:hypothetical protein